MFIKNFNVGDIVIRRLDTEVSFGILSEIRNEYICFAFNNGKYWFYQSLFKNYKTVLNESFTVINSEFGNLKKNIDKEYTVGDKIFLVKKYEKWTIFIQYKQYLSDSPYLNFDYDNGQSLFFGKILRFNDYGAIISFYNHVTENFIEREIFVPNSEINGSQIVENFDVKYIETINKNPKIFPGDIIFNKEVFKVIRVFYCLNNLDNNMLYCISKKNQYFLIKSDSAVLLKNDSLPKNTVTRISDAERYFTYFWSKDAKSIFGLVKTDFSKDPKLILELIN